MFDVNNKIRALLINLGKLNTEIFAVVFSHFALHHNFTSQPSDFDIVDRHSTHLMQETRHTGW